MVTLFRAVTQVELDDILATSRFRDSPHKAGEKGFFFEKVSAVALALKAYKAEGIEHFVVRTAAQKSVIERARPHIAAGEGAGVYFAEEDLDRSLPPEEVSF